MLILFRKIGESIQIGDGIRIVVTSCDRRGVRLGIEAPGDVSILREEILEAVAAENQRATTADTKNWLGSLPLPSSAVSAEG